MQVTITDQTCTTKSIHTTLSSLINSPINKYSLPNHFKYEVFFLTFFYEI